MATPVTENTATDLHRIALGLEYDGTGFNGWQIQSHAPSIQQHLNSAISAVADEPVSCVGAGRTDAGVHASGQVAHFDTVAHRSPRNWLLGINSQLPDDINVNWAVPVDSRFHARYSTRRRGYRYTVLNRPVRSALWRHRAWWVRESVDASRMAAAASALLGEHDFSAFRAAACQSKTPVRELFRLDVRRSGELVIIDCEANAFLHHMVRNIVGSLVRVGCGEESTDWLGQLLGERDRTLSGMTAPACGLCLTRVEYPAEFGLPTAVG